MVEDKQILEELQKIRELLTPKPAPAGRKGLVGEFIDFVSKYKVLGLAVAFVLGLYLGEVVKGLVQGLIMPGIQDMLSAANVTSLGYGQFAPYRPGLFIMAGITFVIVCIFIFIVMKIAKKWNIE